LLVASAPLEKPESSNFDLNDWVEDCIDCPRYFHNLTNRSAVLDSSDLPHVAYGGDHLYYGYLNSAGTWRSEVVDASYSVGSHAALVLDSSENPHIIYYDSANRTLKYAYHDGVEWQIESFPFGSLTDPQLSLAIDSTDRVHVTFYNDVAGDLIYGVITGTGVYFEVVDSTGDVGKFSSIALDGNNLPHISYHDVTNTQLKYAYFDGSDWTIETFLEVDQHGYDTDIAIDHNGYPHIVYRGGSADYPKPLMYRFQDGAGWHLEIVDESEFYGWTHSVGYFNSIHIDNNGVPHISYSAYWESIAPYPWIRSYDLRYAHRSSGSWEIELIDFDYAKNATLLLHSAAEPSVIYKGQNRLRYIQRTNFGWTEEKHLDWSEFVGVASSVDKVFFNQPHVSYQDSEGHYRKYAKRSPSGWVHDPPHFGDEDWYTDYFVPLSLSPKDHPHILYTTWARFGNNFHHTFYDGSRWYVEDFWDSFMSYNYAGSYDLEVDHRGNVHVVYGGGQYLYKDTYWRESEDIGLGGSGSYPLASIWRESEVIGLVGSYPHFSITVASSGKIHVASTGDILKYAFKDDGEWFAETVDSGDFSSPSIGVDSSGYPHISYYDVTTGNLNYAKFNGISWSLETIDELGDVGSYSSLGVGLPNYVHIAYYDATNGDLKYAYFDGSDWEINTLVSEGDVGSHCSLVLDPFGNPHITFHDAGLGDLKIIYIPHGTIYDLIFPFVFK
jgi:hypothetical protein